MAAFSATDVAFEGFRITRERPKWVLGWAGLYFVVQLLSLVVLGALVGTAMTDLQQAMSGSGGQPDVQAMMAIYGRMAPAYAILLPVSLAMYAVQICAVYRAALRPQEPSWLGMRLGGDELRVFIVMVAVFLLLMVVYLVGVIVVALVAGGVGAATNGGAAAVVGVVLALILLCVLAFFMVRLSFATVLTFVERDFRVFESWRATQGHFWPLLGAYLLALVFSILVSLLVLVVVAAVLFGGAAALGQSGGDAMAAMSDPTRLMSTLGPLVVVYLAVSAIGSVMSYVLLLAPPAAAWRQISGQETVFA